MKVEQPGEQGFKVDIARHAPSEYKNYLAIEQGGDPNTGVDYNKQIPDLTEAGMEFAGASAREYAESVDPEKEMVVIISSKEIRAWQTASIFLDELEKRRVEIFTGLPSQQRPGAYPLGFDELMTGESEEKLEKRIIPHHVPSLRYPAIWVQDMLEPTVMSRKTTFKGLDESRLSEKDKKRYRTARAIIEKEGDMDATWGDNYVRFENQGYPFDIVPTVKDNHRLAMAGLRLLRKLNNSVKTKEFEDRKGKKIRYLIFTHEENMLEMARAYFGQGRVNNCDVISLLIPEDKESLVSIKFRGATKTLSYAYLAGQPKVEGE